MVPHTAFGDVLFRIQNGSREVVDESLNISMYSEYNISLWSTSVEIFILEFSSFKFNVLLFTRRFLIFLERVSPIFVLRTWIYNFEKPYNL